MQRDSLDRLTLVSGFNAPEEHFVWSQYEFSVRFDADASVAALLCNAGAHGGTLNVQDGAGRRFAYPLKHGENWLLFSFIDQPSRTLRCSVTPRVQQSSDIRELGLMVRHVEHFGSVQLARAWSAEGARGLVEPVASVADAADFAGSTDPAAVLYERALRAPLERGWIKVLWANTAHPDAVRITCIFYPPQRLGISSPDRFQLCVRGSAGDLTADFALLDDALTKLGFPQGAISAEVIVKGGADGVAGLSFDVGVRDTWLRDDLLPWQSHHWRGYGTGGIPGPTEILRVAGPVGTTGFCFGGASWYTKLERVVAAYTGRAIADLERILDWGCGCARISRFAPDAVRRRIVGVDIDRHNIDWCRATFADARFVTIAPDPPIDFEPASFDLVFGNSVFTHLTETAQDQWLAEHRRLLRPGGLCVVTAALELGWSVMLWEHRDVFQYADYVSRGIRDSGWLDVGVDASKPGYYRNTWHTADYVARRWSRYFDILDILDGFSDFQSLVVMRRRADGE